MRLNLNKRERYIELVDRAIETFQAEEAEVAVDLIVIEELARLQSIRAALAAGESSCEKIEVTNKSGVFDDLRVAPKLVKAHYGVFKFYTKHVLFDRKNPSAAALANTLAEAVDEVDKQTKY